MLSADRVAGGLVLLKAVDVVLRGPGAPPLVVWAAAVSAFVGAAVVLLVGRGSRGTWAVLAVATAAVCVDAPVELRRQHLVLLAGVALAATVARDERERLLLWRFQLTALYGTAAAAKLNETFLGGDVLAVALRDGPLPVVRSTGVLLAAGVVVVAVEAALAVTPWVARLRVPGTALAALLHVAALPALASDPFVGLRLLFFGGTAVLLHAASAGLVRPGPRSGSPGGSARR